ncbi:DUF2071 domain-containing protein [Bacillus sp. FJAT-29790]|uniref:YqjF family protein n=1 Tax=Bacillus sp. FJAT-29790 TaxID=1895002 RepID=UPI001C244BD6|nr:DUF2071 domain-containing protein [Bacillus sp. FJAT-29790]MBU8880406.1 DUF2071 domain-containing protein [Bacillus sp. FJAT-29790]
MNLINEVAHRPWPVPSNKWVMRQTWSNLLFLHWPISSESLRPYIPPSIQIDIFGEYAWLGVILFVTEGVYPRGLSSVSLACKFPEINLRTYVIYNGKPGIYFLSLDSRNWASTMIGKSWFHLPYYYAQISFQQKGQAFHFQSTRKGKIDEPIKFSCNYAHSSEVYFTQEGTLDHWLTERYCMFSSDKGSNIYSVDLHHRPWPLQKAEAEIYTNTLFSPFHFDLSEVKPLSHFSKGIDALFWNIKKQDHK